MFYNIVFELQATLTLMFKSLQSNIMHYRVGSQILDVVRTTRKNSIALKVRANKVVIFVPKHYSNKQLQKVLSVNKTWLMQALSKLDQTLQSREKKWVFNGENGDSFDFLGRIVIVVLQPDNFNKGGGDNFFPQVHIKGEQCSVLGDLQSNQQVCFAIKAFMIQTAQTYLSSKLKYYAQRIGVTYQSVIVKGYKSRWGSCCLDGRLQFNWRLWQAPEWVIDYVIVHELCHRIHPNHSQAFWALVVLHYPRMKEAKKMIRQQGERWVSFL